MRRAAPGQRVEGVVVDELHAHAGALRELEDLLLFGSVGGWLSAFGGAFKDAPMEGFHTFKFFRSPALAAFYSWLLSFLTDSYMIGAVGGLGYTVATIETYKTFFFPNKPRGKFAGKPILHPEHLARRRSFVPLYAGIWALVLGHLAWALAQR